MAKLTERQKRFIDFYIECANATEAAKKAGYKGKNLDKIGCENLRKLEDHLQERLKKLEDERIASAVEVLQTLTRVLRREEKESVVVTTKHRKSYYDQLGKKVIDENEIPEIVEIAPKLSDVNKAAELLGKRYGLYTDKVNVDGDLNINIEVDYGD